MEGRVAAARYADRVHAEVGQGAVARVVDLHGAVGPVAVEDGIPPEPLAGEQHGRPRTAGAEKDLEVIGVRALACREFGTDLHLESLVVIAQDDVDHAS